MQKKLYNAQITSTSLGKNNKSISNSPCKNGSQKVPNNLPRTNTNVKSLQIFISKMPADEGTYSCNNCGQKIYLQKNSKMPYCKKCGCDKFCKQKNH